jgi:hypothetical protein
MIRYKKTGIGETDWEMCEVNWYPRNLYTVLNGSKDMELLSDSSTPIPVGNSSYETGSSLVKQLVNAEFMTGNMPFSDGGYTDDARPSLRKNLFKDVPGQIIRDSRSKSSRTALLVGPHYRYFVYANFNNDSYSVSVYGVDGDEVTRITRRLMSRSGKPRKDDPNQARLAFWFMAGDGPEHSYRNIDVRPWDKISANYSKKVHDDLGDLMTLTPENIPGKMLLFYGPPGTGKTTLIRSLASEWRKWCEFHIVMDPDIMLNSGSYITTAVLSESKKPWKMIVLEDCGDLIKARPENAGSNQGLARLLNLTDGILGQGKNILMCITTNEAVEKLNPAVMRAGRCLANLHIPRFTQDEAEQWLGGPLVDASGDQTLGDLIHNQNGGNPIGKGPAVGDTAKNIGQYL